MTIGSGGRRAVSSMVGLMKKDQRSKFKVRANWRTGSWARALKIMSRGISTRHIFPPSIGLPLFSESSILRSSS